MAPAITALVRLSVRIHRDREGTISILSVFAVMLLTMLLGMVMNVGRHVDGKIRMQNSADAAAYSGTVVLARGMNTLAFTNHLLCDVMAMTSIMRESRDRNAQAFTPEVLAAWNKIGPVFGRSNFPKFEALSPAIVAKVPLEQELVDAYSDWAAASSERILPLLEEILAEELIPVYQRSVVEAFPDIAQTAAMEVTLRNGEPERRRGRMLGVLWRASGEPVGGDYEMTDRTLPAVDPVMDSLPDQGAYLQRARQQRKEICIKYLRIWNNQMLRFFDREAKMSQFGALWRAFTCGHLKQLLEEEYPYANLPQIIHEDASEAMNTNELLERNFTFVAVVYWRKLPEMLPGLFRNPLQSDAVAYAESRMFVPQRRLEWQWPGPGGRQPNPIGGVPGEFPPLPGEDDSDQPGGSEGEGYWRVGRQNVPTYWNLLNQHWTCQLVPATQTSLSAILQTPPTLPAFAGEDFALPDLGTLESEDIGRISPH